MRGFVFFWFFHTLSRMGIQITSLSGIGCVFYNLRGSQCTRAQDHGEKLYRTMRRSTKVQTPNNKQYRNTNFQNAKLPRSMGLGNLNFEIEIGAYLRFPARRNIRSDGDAWNLKFHLCITY